MLVQAFIVIRCISNNGHARSMIGQLHFGWESMPARLRPEVIATHVAYARAGLRREGPQNCLLLQLPIGALRFVSALERAGTASQPRDGVARKRRCRSQGGVGESKARTVASDCSAAFCLSRGPFDRFCVTPTVPAKRPPSFVHCVLFEPTRGPG